MRTRRNFFLSPWGFNKQIYLQKKFFYFKILDLVYRRTAAPLDGATNFLSTIWHHITTVSFVSFYLLNILHMTYWTFDTLEIWRIWHVTYWAFDILNIWDVGHLTYYTLTYCIFDILDFLDILEKLDILNMLDIDMLARNRT